MDDQVTLRVYFLDGTSLGIGCTRLSTVGEVRDLVVAKLRLPPAHAACFELYVAPERGPLCDELAREAIASGVDLRERSAGPPRRLTFAVRLYVDGATLGVRRRKEGEDGMASMLGAMMARDDDAETVGSEESVYEHTTESNPGMWGTVVDSKPDEEGDDGMASMLAGMMATGDEGKP